MLTFHDCRAPQAVELSHRAREITVETHRDPLAVQVYVWREKGGESWRDGVGLSISRDADSPLLPRSRDYPTERGFR